MSFARRSQGVYLLALGMLLFLPQWGEARPEFANRHGINRCTACHFSPAGGGLRNTNGKLYGAHGFQISKYASQDFVSADMRFVHYNPAGKEDKRSGLFLMAGLIGGSVAITPEEINTEVRAVVSHDVLNQSNWDSYVRFRRYTDTETGWLPQYIVFGRFHAPFGLLTDEHRTYTKMQTLSDYNTKMEAGLMVSGQPLDSLHYDFAVVNGEASSAELNDGQAELYGGISNLRYISSSQWLPLTLGVSHKFYDRVPGQKNPWAAAAYTIFSMERLTGGWLNMDIMFEYAQAKNLNEVATASTGFPTDANYKANILDKESKGLFGQINYYISEKFVLQFKHDRLDFNKDYSADAYQRFGYGIKHYFAANSLMMLRFEKTKIGQPDEKNNPFHRADDAAWVYLQVGI